MIFKNVNLPKNYCKEKGIKALKVRMKWMKKNFPWSKIDIYRYKIIYDIPTDKEGGCGVESKIDAGFFDPRVH